MVVSGSAGSLQPHTPVAEPETEFVEELDVLEEVVVAGPGVAVLVVVPARGDDNGGHVWEDNDKLDDFDGDEDDDCAPVDEELDHGLHVVGGDERLLLALAGDEGHPADRHHVRPLGAG